MWKYLKLPRFSIQTTEKLFMPNVTFDSNTDGARDSRPAGSWYTTNVSIAYVRSARSYKHASRTIMNKFNVIQTWPVQIPNIIFH